MNRGRAAAPRDAARHDFAHFQPLIAFMAGHQKEGGFCGCREDARAIFILPWLVHDALAAKASKPHSFSRDSGTIAYRRHDGAKPCFAAAMPMHAMRAFLRSRKCFDAFMPHVRLLATRFASIPY